MRIAQGQRWHRTCSIWKDLKKNAQSIKRNSVHKKRRGEFCSNSVLLLLPSKHTLKRDKKNKFSTPEIRKTFPLISSDFPSHTKTDAQMDVRNERKAQTQTHTKPKTNDKRKYFLFRTSVLYSEQTLCDLWPSSCFALPPSSMNDNYYCPPVSGNGSDEDKQKQWNGSFFFAKRSIWSKLFGSVL